MLTAGGGCPPGVPLPHSLTMPLESGLGELCKEGMRSAEDGDVLPSPLLPSIGDLRQSMIQAGKTHKLLLHFYNIASARQWLRGRRWETDLAQAGRLRLCRLGPKLRWVVSSSSRPIYDRAALRTSRANTKSVNAESRFLRTPLPWFSLFPPSSYCAFLFVLGFRFFSILRFCARTFLFPPELPLANGWRQIPKSDCPLSFFFILFCFRFVFRFVCIGDNC